GAGDLAPCSGSGSACELRPNIHSRLYERRLRAGAEVKADFGRGAIRVPIQWRPLRATNCQESAARFEIFPPNAVPFSRPQNRGMLARQHEDKTRAAELFPASSPLASPRPVAPPHSPAPAAPPATPPRPPPRRPTCKTSDI